jgi:flagellar hook-basal body complex protein FliE
MIAPMVAPILPVSGISLPDPLRPGGASGGSGGFRDVLSSAIQTVEGASNNASASVERFLSGEGEELHTTVIATQKAELSFELFMQARNKVVSAYQEIMRMQM